MADRDSVLDPFRAYRDNPRPCCITKKGPARDPWWLGEQFRFVTTPYAPVAQLDRVPGYEPGGRRFESFRARQCNQILNKFSVVRFRVGLTLRLTDCALLQLSNFRKGERSPLSAGTHRGLASVVREARTHV